MRTISIIATAALIAFPGAATAGETAGATTAPFCGIADDPRCAPARQVGPTRRVHQHVRDANGNPILITVPTAAGIDITVAPEFAAPMQAFIADIVAAGYRPSRIKCFSLSKSHVPNSRHFTGKACDFNQHGWNKTDRFMYRVRAIAAKHGLRDGCSFGDCGHIDIGVDVAGHRKMPHVAELPTAERQP